jgi:anti-sigma regulatory factor (Ser/Thr protein kinase)
VTKVVEVPTWFDDRVMDQFAKEFGDWPPEQKILVDARTTKWASPYGLIAMLTAAQSLAEQDREKPQLTVPESPDVCRYWAKTGFFKYAEDLFEIHGKVPRTPPDRESDVLLKVTPVRASHDVHEVVGHVQEGAGRMLTDVLGIPAKATLGFAMALSEACQNIVEHAGAGGWVSVHAYTWRKRIGKKVVVIAVSDTGVGFRRSLEASQAKRFGDRWGDASALEAALIQGVSRFRDPGRGQGLAGIKRYLSRWAGKIGIRSGTARLSIVPDWDDDVPLAEHLPYFPGSQVQIVIPQQDAPPE